MPYAIEWNAHLSWPDESPKYPQAWRRVGKQFETQKEAESAVRFRAKAFEMAPTRYRIVEA